MAAESSKRDPCSDSKDACPAAVLHKGSKLEAEVDFLKVNKLSADDVVHESVTLHERWPSMQPDDKRKIVEALIEKIVIGDDGIDISYSHLPSSEELCKNHQELGLG